MSPGPSQKEGGLEAGQAHLQGHMHEKTKKHNKRPKRVILGFTRHLLSPARPGIRANPKVELVYAIKGKALLN